jgi:hypothetical protein
LIVEHVVQIGAARAAELIAAMTTIAVVVIATRTLPGRTTRDDEQQNAPDDLHRPR